jgi:hypothetical protein
MDRNIVSAARWLGASLVLSSLILAVGLHLTLSANATKVRTSLEKAGSNARTTGVGVVLQPATQFQQATPFRVTLQQSAPIKVETTEKPTK